MFRVFPELLGTLATLLPPWALALLGVAFAAVAVPSWLHWLRTKQIRGALRRMGRADSAEARQAHIEEAFALAADKGRRLVALADEALKLNARPVWERALRRLEATGQAPDDVQRLREKVEAKPKRGTMPLEEVVIIERMWDEGLRDAARHRLHEALERFPDDDELRDLAEQLASQGKEDRAPVESAREG